MNNWHIYESETQEYVAVDGDLPIHILGEPCFGGEGISANLALRLLDRFGGYRFDCNGLHVHTPHQPSYGQTRLAA